MTLSKWRANQQENGGSIAMNDGSRPTKPIVITVRYMIQDLDQTALDNNDNETKTTCRDQVEKMTITEDGLKPKDHLYTTMSMEEDIDKLSNQWILDPGSNTLVINTCRGE
jgi:hypothetical protein